MLTHTLIPSAFRNSLYPWSGCGDLGRLRDEVNRLFSTGSAFPALNVWSNDEEAIVKAELPGFESEDIEIAIEGNTLSLSGSRELEEVKEGEKLYHRERRTGKFSRSLKLPVGVDADKVTAEFRNGVLSIALPRAAEHKPKKVEVKTS